MRTLNQLFVEIHMVCLLFFGFIPQNVRCLHLVRNVMMRKQFSSSLKHNANGISLDLSVFSNNPDLILHQLARRKSSSLLFEKVDEIHMLRMKRSQCLKEGDAARNTRKKLSVDIGNFIKSKDMEKVEQLKAMVALKNYNYYAMR